MAGPSKQTFSLEEVKPAVNLVGFFLIILAVISGVIMGLLVLPHWIPGYAQTLSSEKPTVFWFLSRSSAIVAYLILWFSMVLGVGVTNKLASRWPGLVRTNELHQYLAFLGISFGLFHGLILLGDKYMNFSLWQLFIPFSTSSYRPAAVGLGQLAFYAWIMILLSFYLRRKIGLKAWRKIHYFTYAVYLGVLIHGLLAGTDASIPWMKSVYWATAGILLFLTVYRILYEVESAREKRETLQTNTQSKLLD